MATKKDMAKTQTTGIDWGRIDTEIEYVGKKITLPGDPAEMPLDAAIHALKRRKEEEAVVYQVNEFIPGAYWDAGLAFFKAMQRRYGWVATRGIQSFFGEIKPSLITVKTGPGPMDVAQFPFGQFNVPNVENPIYAQFDRKDGVPGLSVSGEVRKKEQMILVELCADAKQIVLDESIYRGQAVRLRIDDEGALNHSVEPEFLNLADVKESDLIFSTDTGRLIETNLFTPLRRTDLCRQNKIPLKRGILFEGPYGCGKTLTARVTAKIASENNWTFITLDRATALREAIEFARLYQPAILFAEDIDREADRDEDSVNDLVNIIDGILTKNVEIFVVLTTNFVEKIDKALLRPGRFDAVISIDAPNAEAVDKLVRHYSGALLASKHQLHEVNTILAGNIPATIREVVERAKLAMILDGKDEMVPDDLRIAALGMQRHLMLLAEKKNDKSPGDQLAEALRRVVGGADTSELDDQMEKVVGTSRLAAKNADQASQWGAATHKAALIAAGSAQTASQKADGIAKQASSLTKLVTEVKEIVENI